MRRYIKHLAFIAHETLVIYEHCPQLGIINAWRMARMFDRHKFRRF